MQAHLNRLSSIFLRPVTGIHNSTYGPIVDMLMSALVPLITSSSCSMTLHMELRDALMSRRCRKVIIMAHGTGATILSHTLDKLHADLPMELMSKIEVYTFGSAAKHISNPCIKLDKSTEKHMRADGAIPNSSTTPPRGQTMRMEENERVIPVRPSSLLLMSRK